MSAVKETVKSGIIALFYVLGLPIYGSFLLLGLCLNRDALISSYSQLLSLIPGQVGIYLRKACYRFMFKGVNPDSLISFGVLFSQQDTEIGPGVYIGPQCNIGKCNIETNCLLGSGVHIMSGKSQHIFRDIDVPMKEQGGVFEKINIGEDTWIGNGAMVMANIGKKCVVGAGSVVTEDVADYSIVAGNPAKVIKMRK